MSAPDPRDVPWSQAAGHAPLWHAGGWQVLLPPLSQRHVLCVDSHGWVAALLAAHSARVTVWCPAAAAVRVRRRLAQLHIQAEVVGLAPGPQPWREALAAVAVPFDGIVIAHTGLWRAPDAPRDGTVGDAWADLAPQALSADGFIYLECGNRWAVRSRANRPGAAAAELCDRPQQPLHRVHRLLHDRGMAQLRVHPYLLSHERIEEVIAPRGYRSTKNRELRRERLKELFFGRWGARRFAHAYGVVGMRRPQACTVLDLILERVSALPAAPSGLQLEKVLVFHSMKLILVLQAMQSQRDGLVVVVSRDPVVTQRRLQEARLLEALQRLPAELTRLLPRLHARFSIDGHDCFVLTRVPGLTLEADVPSLHTVSEHAVDFLAALNRQGAATVTIDDAVFDAVFAPVFERAAATVTALRGEIDQLREQVRAAAAGQQMQVGWCHGDFKVENVVYDPASLQLTGVLDWEHATRTGLPYLDLLYLLLYNRGIRGQGWMQAMAAWLLDGGWTVDERRLHQRFLQATGAPAGAAAVLTAVFLVHHFGVRMGLTQWSAGDLSALRGLLARCSRALADPSAAGAATPLQQGPLTCSSTG